MFGELGSQTNGSTQETKPFGFSFAGQQEQKQPDSDPSQNLFFQCMAQTKASSPSQVPGQNQPKDTNYFTAISESLTKEPPSLFKPSASSDPSKKPVLSSPAQGLFGSTALKDQAKAPEAQPAGNGVVQNKTFGTTADSMPKLTPAFSGGIGSTTPFGTSSLQSPGLGMGGLGNPLTPGASALASGSSGIRSGNGNSAVGGLGLLTASNKTLDTGHQNLFLQASSGESTNPFLACGSFSHTPFSGGATLQQTPAASASAPSSTLSPLPSSTPVTAATGDEGKSNLFTMAEPPKGILPSPFTVANSSSSLSQTNTFTQMPKCTTNAQQVGKSTKEGSEAGSGMLGGSSSEGMFGGDKTKSASSFPPFGAARSEDTVTLPFEQSGQQKFPLEERGQSSKRDSDSSTNSDLSDLSETEEASGQGPKQGPQGSMEENTLQMQKNKSQAAAKGRPRSKPIKGRELDLQILALV